MYLKRKSNSIEEFINTYNVIYTYFLCNKFNNIDFEELRLHIGLCLFRSFFFVQKTQNKEIVVSFYFFIFWINSKLERNNWTLVGLITAIFVFFGFLLKKIFFNNGRLCISFVLYLFRFCLTENLTECRKLMFKQMNTFYNKTSNNYIIIQ